MTSLCSRWMSPGAYILSLLVVILSVSVTSIGQDTNTSTRTIGQCLSAEEAELGERINTYRQQHGLSSVPVSRSLVTVAQYHVVDLQTYHPDQGTDQRGMACNLHSWSANGPWSPVCYTRDHHYASGMWDKPTEITGNIYTAPGFENAYWNSGGATAANAFTAWSNSTAHNDVILNRNNWSDIVFRAMGVGIYEGYAVLWFGQQTDPQGTLSQCYEPAPAELDLNNDGRISPADAIYAVNRIGSQNSPADVNQDGSVTAADVQLITDFIGTATGQ